MSDAPKAIALMSGGLDSSLAVRILHDMGIRLAGVHFTGPFCMCNRGAGGCAKFAKRQAESLGISFTTKPLGKSYLDIVVHPKHGYGSAMNPCMDCRILMLRGARQMMEEEDASFVATGEVVGQRPMSQLRHKLQLIEREAGLEGLILRPLSARHLPATIPEREGWVDRDKLMGIHGRGRTGQIELAEKLAIGDYPCPAGGCLLTDQHFADRLRDHLAHGELGMEDIPLLKVGRHFRLPDGSKLVVGRDEVENGRLGHLARPADTLIEPQTIPGPSALLRGSNVSEEIADLANGIAAGFCDGDGPVALICRRSPQTRRVTRERIPRADSARLRI